MLVNTSFNVRGEPIVCTPEDAYRCFLATEMDALVLEDVIVLKKDVVGPRRRRRARASPGAVPAGLESTSNLQLVEIPMQWSDVTKPPSEKMLGSSPGSVSSSLSALPRGAGSAGNTDLDASARRRRRRRRRDRPARSESRQADLRRLDDRGVSDRLGRVARGTGRDLFRRHHADRPGVSR